MAASVKNPSAPTGQDLSAVSAGRADGARPPVLDLGMGEGWGACSAITDALRAYCHLEDETPVHFALAVAVAAHLDGDPLWGLIVGSPSGGKTEAIRTVEAVADDQLDEVTAAGLLSWSKARKPRPTGLLTRIGSPAFATIADLSTLLAGSDRGQRDMTYALLRRVFDGSVTRELGQQEPLHWKGKLSLLAAATQDVDRYASHADALGPRWLYLRVPELSAEGRRLAAEKAREYAHEKTEMRAAAQHAACDLVVAALRQLPNVLVTAMAGGIIDRAAIVASLGRAAVPRTGYGAREVIGEAVREEPMRLVGQLTSLHHALLALGAHEAVALQIVQRAALDSMPLTRRKVLSVLATGEVVTAADIARRVHSDRKVVRFALEDLHVIGACRYEGDDQDDEEASRPRKQWRLAGPDAQIIAQAFRVERCGTKRGNTTHLHPQEEKEVRRDTPQFVPQLKASA